MKNELINNEKGVKIDYRILKTLYDMKDYDIIDEFVCNDDNVVIKSRDYSREIMLKFEPKFNRVHQIDYIVSKENDVYKLTEIMSSTWDLDNDVDLIIESIKRSI